MPPKTTELKTVAHAVIERWGVRDSRGRTNKWWSELLFESSWNRLEHQLSIAEWEEFLRLCSDTGVPKSQELRTFRSMMALLSYHGDDGYGDRYADMSHIVYWFQHVGNIPEPRRDALDRERSPRR